MGGRGAGELVVVQRGSGEFEVAGSEHHVFPAWLGQRGDLEELGRRLRGMWVLGVRADDVAVVCNLWRSSHGIGVRYDGSQRVFMPREAVVLALQDDYAATQVQIIGLADAKNLLDRPPGRADAVQVFDGDAVSLEWNYVAIDVRRRQVV